MSADFAVDLQGHLDFVTVQRFFDDFRPVGIQDAAFMAQLGPQLFGDVWCKGRNQQDDLFDGIAEDGFGGVGGVL